MSNNKNNLEVSFEFFPAKSEHDLSELIQHAQVLQMFNPSFASVTYGANSSARNGTLNTIKKVASDTTISNIAAHLTCLGHSKQEILGILRDVKTIGVKHLVVLRGDKRLDGIVGDYRYAEDLINEVKNFDKTIEISVAGYPEKHPESDSIEEDIFYLKQKVNAGADRIITQFFFDNNFFFDFQKRCLLAGINIDIFAGILPIINHKKAFEFANKCQTFIPDFMHEMYSSGDDHETSSRFVRSQVVDLYKAGCRKFHFYTINKSELSYAACRALKDINDA